MTIWARTVCVMHEINLLKSEETLTLIANTDSWDGELQPWMFPKSNFTKSFHSV